MVSEAYLQNLIDYRCSPQDAAYLVGPVTAEEVKRVVFSLPLDKAPGPDGYPVEFYREAWSIVGKDLITAVQSFFLFGFMPRGVNSTILTLIPKQDDVKTMKDYRPIACCNTVYKVISKIIANRLKTTLPQMIEWNQSAFVKDRLLLENVLLATELVKEYHKDTISSRCAIKFDISKAFDTVRWEFITSTLRAMRFPDQFIHWIFLCMSTSSFSVSINGELAGFFQSERGIRQGCSLSPYLYVIVSNVLSRMLNKAAQSGGFGYHPKCQKVEVTHLSFADDILVFTDGKPGSILGIIDVFKRFASISGLNINASKSSIFSAGVDKVRTINAAHGMGLTSSELPIRYLGLPLTTKSMSRHDYEPLIDKIRTRLLSWSSQTLSYAGRLQLIKSVIMSISNFWCSVFRLPQRCLDEIEGMCSGFLWGGSPNIRNKAKVAWEEICCPVQEGGLGIRRLRDSSRVFSLSLIWRLFTSSGSLWVAWTRAYLLKQNSFWNVKDRTLGSWIWRKLLKLRDLAKEFIRWEVCNGENTYFWWDTWLSMGQLYSAVGEAGPRNMGVGLMSTVAEAGRGNRWRVRRGRNPMIQLIVAAIHSHPLPCHEMGSDVAMWRHGPDDYKVTFSARCTWNQIRKVRNEVPWHSSVWFPQAIPRYSFITWLAVRDRLSTGTRTRLWGQHQVCLFCSEPDESRDHLFFACPFTFTIWTEVAGTLLGNLINPDWTLSLRRLSSNRFCILDKTLLRMAFQSTIYHIWRERNGRRHGQQTHTTTFLVTTIGKAIQDRIISLHYAEDSKFKDLLQRWLTTRS